MYDLETQQSIADRVRESARIEFEAIRDESDAYVALISGEWVGDAELARVSRTYRYASLRATAARRFREAVEKIERQPSGQVGVKMQTAFEVLRACHQYEMDDLAYQHHARATAGGAP